jgi:hypothetical protein
MDLSFQRQSGFFFDIHYKSFDEKVHCSDVPKFIRVNKLTYKLLCCQIIVNAQSKTAAHFKGIFLIDDCFFLVDDLYPGKKINVPKLQKVTSCLKFLQ